MRTPPTDLDADDLAAVLAVEWGLGGVGLRYAPVGFGGQHWTAAVGDRPTWFVTASRPSPGLVPAFETAAALADTGAAYVVAPVRTELGAVVAASHGWAVSVTPYLADAVDHHGSGHEVVALAASLHSATAGVRGSAPVDDLTVEARGALDGALGSSGEPWADGPYTEPVRDALAAHAASLRDRLEGYDAAVAAVHRDGFVLTHGELKPGNLLATPDGIALVDWDTARLAPPERDLWRLPADDLEAYAERTGRTPDPAVLDLFRARWDLTDIALYVEQLRTAPARTADTETAWSVLRELLP